ncbi:MAG: penicillin-binding protein activator LpoB [bacterium]
MSRVLRCARPVLLAGIAVILGAGCQAFQQSVQTVDVNTSKPMDAKYDYSDLRNMSSEMVDRMLASEFMKKISAAPIVAIFSVENRTTMHIDTQAMTDTMRSKLMDAGKMKFVNTARRDDLLKEQGYQNKHVTPETAVKIGKQLGARYMITGSVVELTRASGREVRVSSKEEVYYQFTVELTDLETGLVELAPQVERARKASKPIIGW